MHVYQHAAGFNFYSRYPIPQVRQVGTNLSGGGTGGLAGGGGETGGGVAGVMVSSTRKHLFTGWQTGVGPALSAQTSAPCAVSLLTGTVLQHPEAHQVPGSFMFESVIRPVYPVGPVEYGCSS